jgi:hypothetical protein
MNVHGSYGEVITMTLEKLNNETKMLAFLEEFQNILSKSL